MNLQFKRNNITIFIGQSLLIFSIIVYSFADQAEKGFNFSQNFAASVNPAGLLLSSQLFFRLPIVKKPGILWESTKIDAGIVNDFSPAFENPGIFIRCEPIAFFDITLYVNSINLFKALGSGYVAIKSYSSLHNDEHIEGLPQSDQHGWWIRSTPTIKLAYKRFILANITTMHYFQMKKKGYYLERYTNTILDNKDFVVNNELFLFFKFNNVLLSGLNFTFQTVPASNENFYRLGPAFIYNKKINYKTNLAAVLISGSYLPHSFFDKSNPYAVLMVQLNTHLRKKEKKL